MNEPPDEGVPLAADEAAHLSTLFEQHADRLYRVARRLVANADDALDLVQETFLNVAKASRAAPRGSTDEEAWLVRILVNIRRDQWRKANVRKKYEHHLHPAPARRQNLETSLSIRASVWKALEDLAPRRRAVIVLHEMDGVSIAAIASLLGINAITVRWHLSRGRRELARRLRCELGDTDEPQPHETVAGRRPHAARTTAR
jgi:RNA polymerase sigma-70 factor (ECF subfamily)